MNAIQFDERDEALRQQGLVHWQMAKGARIGDYVEMPDGELKRICQLYPDRFQLADPRFGRSFYWASWYCSHSGGCGDVFPLARLIHTGRHADGPVWFFHHHIAGAHRGVACTVPCRVYRLAPALQKGPRS